MRLVPDLMSDLMDGLEMWLTRGIPLTLPPSDKKLVEYGLGRFLSTQSESNDTDDKHDRKVYVVISEPLALLSICMHFFGEEILSARIASHVMHNNGIGFEVVTMVALTYLLQPHIHKIPLGTLVSFCKQPAWSLGFAQIVSKTLTGYLEVAPDCIFNPNFFPFQAETPEEVTSWLRGESPAVWCVPSNNMAGPDLMTRVRLENEEIVLVLVQAKCRGLNGRTGVTLTTEETLAALKSLKPSTWFSGTVRYFTLLGDPY